MQIASNMDLLSSLTTLRLYGVVPNDHQLHDFEDIRTNIETMELFKCGIGNNFVHEFLASCPKLECLRLNTVDFKSSTTEDSLFRSMYPMLENFEYSNYKEIAPKFVSFSEKNPSLNSVRIDSRDLQAMPLETSTAQLNYLNVNIVRRPTKTDAKQILRRLRTLYGRGFFKKLRLSLQRGVDGIDYDMFIRELMSFDALEALCTADFYTNVCYLAQLKELHLQYLHPEVNLETMSMNFQSLERLCIGGTLDHLTSFIRHSKRLKFVIFDGYTGNHNSLDLLKLNRARQASGIKCKVQIGVFEDRSLYLPTKWNAQNSN